MLLPLLNRNLDGRTGDILAVVSTTGKLSRELYELDDRDGDKRNRFYMVGSMGCASGFGLGIARANPTQQLLVLDGDGSLLMKFGSLATIGCASPVNYHHIVFDNGAHDSTGGQPTPSPAVDFAVAALACGYRRAETVSAPGRLADAVERHVEADGPTLLRVLIKTGSRSELGRPTLTPRQCYQRFSGFLRESR